MESLKTLIVDDSEIDRMNLRLLLGAYDSIEICAEAYDLSSARALVANMEIDLVFLDIHLGLEKGFSLLEDFEEVPEIILTTSHPQYALKGFEIEALDYILKPVTVEKLQRAMKRVGKKQNADAVSSKIQLNPDSQLFFMRNNEQQLYFVKNIALITVERPYTQVTICDGVEYLHKRTLKEWKELLPSEHFLNLDRSCVINKHELSKIVEKSDGHHFIHFKNKEIAPHPIGPKGLKLLREVFSL